jgi:hypothetical protein
MKLQPAAIIHTWVGRTFHHHLPRLRSTTLRANSEPERTPPWPKKAKLTELALTLLMATVTVEIARASGNLTNPCEEASALRLSPIFNPEVQIPDRLNAVHCLGVDLSATEVSALCGFLQQRPGAREKNMLALQLIKNDLLNALMAQKTPPPQLTGVLVEMYRDRQQDFVTRDYAVQHLVTWYELGTESPQAKVMACALLTEAAQQETSIAATALLGMHRLAALDPAFKHQEIRQRALEMVRSPGTELAARITAVQICAEEDAVEAVPLIRPLAFGTAPTALRLSAIAALGRLGGNEDFAKLRELERGTVSPLRTAIEEALRQLQQKYHIQKLV